MNAWRTMEFSKDNKKIPLFFVDHDLFIYLFNFAHKGRVTTTAYANYCGPALPNPPCQMHTYLICV